MRDYGKVFSTFWTSETTADLSDTGKILALYLMTCSHSTITGVFRLPDGYVAEDLKWAPERVEEGFAELFAKGFANRCETSKWVWIRKHLEWNKPENPNQRKAAAKIAFSVPDACAWKREFMRASEEVLAIELPPEPDPSETLGEGLLNQKQEQKQELNQEQEKEGASDARTTTRQKKEECILQTYLTLCKAEGRKPIPDDHPIRAYAADAGITHEMLQIAWLAFREDHTTGTRKNKRQKDWPATFANAVKDNWARIWFDGGAEGIKWSSQGLTRKRVFETRQQREQEAGHEPA